LTSQNLGIRNESGFSILWFGVLQKCGRHPRRKLLVSLFFAFPGGWPGIALLLLRGVPGLVILSEGAFYFAGAYSSPVRGLVGLLALAAGISLVIGLLTPIAASLVTLGAVGVGSSVLPACSPELLDSRLALIFGFTMLVAIIGLGPGAFSIDARVFGRREIIIPPPAV
jgi:hypothetical protein